MAHILIRHKVKDYASWKPVFDSFVEMRRDGGERSWQIWHPEDDPNNLVLLFEWESAQSAHAFLDNPELKAAMEKSGVVEAPEVYVLEEYDRGAT